MNVDSRDGRDRERGGRDRDRDREMDREVSQRERERTSTRGGNGQGREDRDRNREQPLTVVEGIIIRPMRNKTSRGTIRYSLPAPGATKETDAAEDNLNVKGE